MYKNEEIWENKSKQTAMFTSETVLFTFRNEHVYFRNRLGSIFMAVAQVALAQSEKSHLKFTTYFRCLQVRKV